MPSGLVYLVRAGDLHKIGITRNLAFRMSAIGFEVGMPVWLLRTWQSSAPRSLERYLHKMFKVYRIAGEWFRLGYAEIEQLRRLRLNAPALIAGTKPPSVHLVKPPRPKVIPPLGLLMAAYGILTLTELAKRLRIRKQYAWLLWHGRIALSLEMAKRLHEELGIPLADLIQVERKEPAKKRGRKKKGE